MGLSDESGPNYESVFNAAPGNYLLLDDELRIVGVTNAYLAATMTARGAIVGRHLFDVFPDNPADPGADGVRNLRASLQRVLASGRSDRMPVQKYDIRRPESEGGGFEERYWSPLNVPVLSPGGAVSHVIHSVEDVTEIVRLHQEAEHAQALLHDELRTSEGRLAEETFLRAEAVAANRRLSESERRYRFLTDAVPQLIWTADPDGKLDFLNERWAHLTGLSVGELRGDGWLDAIHPDDRDRVVAAWEGAIASVPDRFEIEYRLRDGGGAWRWVMSVALPWRDSSGVVHQWYGATTDINDRVTAEDKLRSAQRMQALGKLAGGMAHEVNNMMTAVIGFGELVSAALGPTHPERADVEEMVKAAARAAEVTRQLLAFSRQQVLRLTVIDLCTVTSEIMSLLRRVAGSDRRLDLKLRVPELRVFADRNQIEQVLINLVANARDATSTNGVITIELDTVVVDGGGAKGREDARLERTQMARLTVRDDGTGMPPEVAARVFEPFFTTKAVGHGTGLGLSMVLGIVEQSGGTIHIDSEVGAGTAVHIDLPAVDAEVTAAAASAAAPRGLGERILVVEDETVVRSLTRRTLASAGYNVSVAPNGAAALEFLHAHRGEIDLVLTDIVMPHLNGLQLAQRVHERYPQIPVLFMSGYTGDEIMQRGLSLADVQFVQKPFKQEVLTTAIRRALDAAAMRGILHANA